MASIRQSKSTGTINVGFNLSESDNDSIHKPHKVELTEKYLNTKYHIDDLPQDDVIKSTIHYVRKNYTPSRNCMSSFFFKRVPFFDWIRKYDIKKDLIKDLTAGLTIGVVQIPSGMAYSLMAGLPAVNGLYITFFVTILYTLFGSSRHASAGTYGIISLMVASSIDANKGILFPTSGQNLSTVDTSQFISLDPVEAKVLIAGALCFFSGIIQIALGLLHIGFVTKYLSDPIVNGFTTGAAYYILVSQISTLLGLKLGKVNIPFALIANIIAIFQVIEKTNPATVVISVVSIIFIYVSKTYINEKFKDKLPVPVPVELIIVVVSIVISYFVNFNGRWSVIIVGPLPLGMPTPKVPALSIISKIIGDSISIAIVSYAINMSIAKLFSKKHKYEIRPNQEFFAYGFGNVFGSFFAGFPACVGLSRCLIFDSIGGRSQLNGIFSSILLLIVLLALGPYFKCLPNAVLAAIIVVTLKNKLIELKDIPKLWRKSRIEALGYLVTFLGVMIFNIDIGLYIGLCFSVLLFVFQSQRPRTTVLGNLPGTNLFENIQIFKEARELNGIKIIRYEESVYFANVENFKYKIIKLSKNHPYELNDKIQTEIKEARKSFKIVSKSVKRKQLHPSHSGLKLDANNNIDVIENKKQIDEKSKMKIIEEIEIKHIILDCSCMNYIDSQGINAIIQLHSNFKDVGISLYLSYCKDSIIDSFTKFLLQDNYDFDCIFISTEEAVRHALSVMDPPDISMISKDVNFIQNGEDNYEVTNEVKDNLQIRI